MKRGVIQGSTLFVTEIRTDLEGKLHDEEQENLIVFVDEGTPVIYFNDVADLQEFIELVNSVEVVEA